MFAEVGGELTPADASLWRQIFNIPNSLMLYMQVASLHLQDRRQRGPRLQS